MKKFTIRLPDKIGKWLERKAKKTGMSMNLIIRRLLESDKKKK